MNDMNIKQNNITTNKHQKIIEDITHIYQQNKCFKNTINSLQEQNKALLLQKNWYKNKLKQFEFSYISYFIQSLYIYFGNIIQISN